jgi:formiminotetrahydrofolate cyclodeaminase
MIQTKLRATIKNRDHLPGTWETPINPDGEEAADYIQNMIEHMGQIIKIALESIDDEQARKQIETHAYAAIKGAQNEHEASKLLGSAGKPLARKVYGI